jgi:hypothetical protein
MTSGVDVAERAVRLVVAKKPKSNRAEIQRRYRKNRGKRVLRGGFAISEDDLALLVQRGYLNIQDTERDADCLEGLEQLVELLAMQLRDRIEKNSKW